MSDTLLCLALPLKQPEGSFTCGKGAGGLAKLPCRLRARLAACTAAAGSLMPWSRKGTSSSISLQQRMVSASLYAEPGPRSALLQPPARNNSDNWLACGSQMAAIL